MNHLHLDRAADSGQCVGRVDGRVVFVTGGLPGEDVEVQITQRGKRFWRGVVDEVRTASPHRVEPPCVYFGQCGGCSWLHADPAEQLRLKADVLEQTLLRLAGIAWDVPVRSLGKQTGWRTRVTLQVGSDGTVGFHRAGSHDLVPVAHCLQAAPELMLDEVAEQSWPGVDRIHLSCSEAGRGVIAGPRRFGPDEHQHTVLGRRFLRAVDGFWQSHVDAAEVLAHLVRSLADPVASVVDLYAGVGLFGLTLLDAMPGATVTLVEGDRTAARYARQNAAGAAQVVAVDVRRWRAQRCDLLVLDPPRAGAGRQVVQSIAAASPDTVIYVSCDAATLARDLRLLSAHGYQPDHIEGLDLFPGTAHVEAVVRLRRR